jgi:uncharacterized delta-60 repeat protein
MLVGALLCLLLALLPCFAQAQSAPDGFNPGANNVVNAIAVQADGKIVVGGYFSTLGGGGTGTTTRNYIGRLNPDGSLDTSFNPGADNAVNAIAVQADGKILVGGGFTTLGGGGTGTTTRNYIGRLNADGSLDTSFNPGANEWVNAIAVQADGKILVGGYFTTLGGGGTGTTARKFIGRLNADGSLDTSFNPGANELVNAISVQADGKILVGGHFTTLGGGGTGTTARNCIGRLNADGSLDTSFNPGANDWVNAIAVQADGKIVVGGWFSALGGGTGTTTRNCIGRLDANGGLDTNFNPEANSQVKTIAVQADGKILAGGYFSRIRRLNANGSLDTSFNSWADGTVNAIAVQADGKIVVGGWFDGLAGGGIDRTERNYIGRLTNTDEALQDLTVDGYGTTITWQRSGASPEVDRVNFDLSTDGVNYASLDSGTRISGGWELTGLSLPKAQNIFIRARGYYSSGQNNGSGSIVMSVSTAFVLAVDPLDFDGNGRPDILWRNASTGDNYVWYLDGVTVQGGGNLPTVADQNWNVVGVADFNNDDKPDILWRNAAMGANYVWYLDGVAVLGGGSLPTVADQNWKVAGVSNFNNDSKPDILWRNAATGDNYVWYMDGVTVLGGGNLPAVADQNWKIVGVTDFNNDDKPDVLWRNAATGDNYVWYMDGVTVLGGGNLPMVADQNWKIVGIADFNNDGKPDVLWRNVSTGDNYVWYLNGMTVLGGGVLPTVTDQNWTIVR